jgi:glycosyltransferase involved in cell wall biosynthesis
MRSTAQLTVVIPTHNRPELLSAAIDSVRAQTFTNWNAIIVDDASKPAARVPDDERFRLHRNEHSLGGAAAKNAGARMADGTIVAFLDDDDLLAPTYFENAARFLEATPDVDVVFMGVKWFGERADAGQVAYESAMQSLLDKVVREKSADAVLFSDPESLFISLLNTVPMAFQRPVFRRSAFEKIGGYQDDILLWDCDWAIRAAAAVRCGLIPDGLYLQRAQGQGYSSRTSRRLEQIRSNILMKERLLSNTHYVTKKKAIMRSLSKTWFDLAWISYQEGRFDESRKHLRNSVKYDFSPKQLKLAIRLILPLKPEEQ